MVIGYLNFTKHSATEDQVKAGVIDWFKDPEFERTYHKMNQILDIESPDHGGFLTLRATEFVELMFDLVERIGTQYPEISEFRPMIGSGHPAFQYYLVKELLEHGIVPVYAFSKRVSMDKEIDGVVVKTSKFVHEGFIEME